MMVDTIQDHSKWPSNFFTRYGGAIIEPVAMIELNPVFSYGVFYAIELSVFNLNSLWISLMHAQPKSALD